MKRILQIGPGPRYSKGGIATVITDISNNKRIYNDFEMNIYESCNEGIFIKRVFFSILMYLKFLKIYKKYDIFHIHMASYGSTFRKGYYVRFLKKHNKKVVLHIHSGAYLCFYNELTDNKKVIVQNIWNICDVVIVLSDKWKERFEPIFPNAKIEVVKNGIDVDKFNNTINKSSVNKMNFLFLAKICKEKGIYDLLNAINELSIKYPKIKLSIAGHGEIEEVNKIITNFNLERNVDVIGWVDEFKKIELLKKVGTVILPSYHEGLPMTILEGMAAGKVILSTTVGAIPEVVTQNENGILVQPGDIRSLINCIEQVIIDDEFRKYCSINNVEKVRRQFDIQIMHQKIIAIYKNLLNEN